MWENAADGKPTNEKVEDRLEKERDECKKMINNSARHERAGLHICKQPRLLAGTACSQKCYYLCIDKLQASLYPKISHAYTMIPVAHQGSPGQRFEPQYLKMSHHISYKKPSSPKDPSHLVMNHHILCWSNDPPHLRMNHHHIFEESRNESPHLLMSHHISQWATTLLGSHHISQWATPSLFLSLKAT